MFCWKPLKKNHCNRSFGLQGSKYVTYLLMYHPMCSSIPLVPLFSGRGSPPVAAPWSSSVPGPQFAGRWGSNRAEPTKAGEGLPPSGVPDLPSLDWSCQWPQCTVLLSTRQNANYFYSFPGAIFDTDFTSQPRQYLMGSYQGNQCINSPGDGIVPAALWCGDTSLYSAPFSH